MSNQPLTPEQASIYYNLMQIWISNPNLRFNQLMTNLLVEYNKRNNFILGTDATSLNAFYLSDKDFAEFLKDFIDEYS